MTLESLARTIATARHGTDGQPLRFLQQLDREARVHFSANDTADFGSRVDLYRSAFFDGSPVSHDGREWLVYGIVITNDCECEIELHQVITPHPAT